jgi:hypothetical protein
MRTKSLLSPTTWFRSHVFRGRFGNNVDYVVEVDSIGDPSELFRHNADTRSPTGCASPNLAGFLRDAGIMRNGFPFRQLRGNCARVRQLPQTNDEAGWRESALRTRRFDEAPRRIAGGRTH